MHRTLLQVNGDRALIAVLVPALIALAPVFVQTRRCRIGAAVLLAAFVLLSGFTIGMFYIPAAIAMAIAASAGPRAEKGTS
jgi:hypothetical protein